MPTYYAITSTNPDNPCIVASGDTRTQAREAAEELLALDACSDIYAITKANNLRVWSRSAASRRYGNRHLEAMEERWGEAAEAAVTGPGPDDEAEFLADQQRRTATVYAEKQARR